MNEMSQVITPITKDSLKGIGFDRIESERLFIYYQRKDIVLELIPLLNLVRIYREAPNAMHRIGEARTIEQLEETIKNQTNKP